MNSEHPAIPDLRHARPEAIAAVYKSDGTPYDTPDAHPAAYRDLERKRACAKDLGPLTLQYENSQICSWDELTSTASEYISAHISRCNMESYAEKRRISPGTAKIHTQEVAQEGVVTICAFLEVIGRVLASKDFDDPNVALATYARRSKGLLMEWASLHWEVDIKLAYALASKKPSNARDALSPGLRFNPRWFTEEAETERIVLDPQKTPNLRDETGYKHPSRQDNGIDELFGCPGRHYIPKLQSFMIGIAEEHRLFAQSYYDERKNHGYQVPEIAKTVAN